MGRPKASNTVRDFALSFANVVTVPSSHHYDVVSRIGKHSIFSLLCTLAPKVHKFQGMIFQENLDSMSQSNRFVLQMVRNSGMQRVRNRRALRIDFAVRNRETLRFTTEYFCILWFCRQGISNAEMNKLLEKFGFRRVRIRLQSIVRYILSTPFHF